MAAPPISVLIVNFNSGQYLAGCLDSLRAQPGGEELELLVLDSHSGLDQTAYLEDARARGARVIELDRNRGYAGACNRGLAESRGRFVFFLNADVLALDDCLTPLVAELEAHAEIGLIEPRTHLDRMRRFVIPEFHRPTRRGLLGVGCARLSTRFARARDRRRWKRTLAFLRAADPLEVGALSGAFLGGRREQLEALGGFDESYPLYYEDTDLFQRTATAGLRLIHHPGARAVHLAHRSTATVWDEAMDKMRLGRERYLRTHLGPVTARGNRLWEALVERAARAREGGRVAAGLDLGTVAEPPELDWQGPAGPYLFELSLGPLFDPAAGCLGEGRSFAFESEIWSGLLAGIYHLRAVDLNKLTERGRWQLRRP